MLSFLGTTLHINFLMLLFYAYVDREQKIALSLPSENSRDNTPFSGRKQCILEELGALLVGFIIRR